MQSSQAIIILLLIANLLATFWYGTQRQAAPPAAAVAPAPGNAQGLVQGYTSPQLPAIISEDVRNGLLEQFITAFNSEDYAALYEMLGPAARTQIDEETTLEEFRKLAQYFHGVEEGAFTHAQLNAQQGNTFIYTLHYLVKLPESSEFGTKGRLTITLAVQGDAFQVFGIRLNGG